MGFGRRLKRVLHLRERNQRELASALGVGESTVSQWANDSREPDLATLRRIAAELKTTVAFLAGETTNPDHPKQNTGQRVIQKDLDDIEALVRAIQQREKWTDTETRQFRTDMELVAAIHRARVEAQRKASDQTPPS